MFVSQYIDFMQCMGVITEAYKPVSRGEKVLIKLQLGEKFGVVLNSTKDSLVHIGLFKEPGTTRDHPG